MDQICSIEQVKGEAKTAIHTDITFGLMKEELIARFTGGVPEYLKEKARASVEDAGLVVTPSTHGVVLFLWAHGHCDRSPDFFFSDDFASEGHLDFDLDRCSPA